MGARPEGMDSGSQNAKEALTLRPCKSGFLREALTLRVVPVHSWHLHSPKSGCFLKFCTLRCLPCLTQVLALGYRRAKGVDTRA